MSDLFKENSNIPDDMTATANESNYKSEWVYFYKRRAEKTLKALKKQMRKNKKLLKEWKAAAEKAAAEKAAAEKAAAEKAAAEKAAREAAEKAAAEKATSNKKNAMQFWADLGKAVCKAVPEILTALATAALGYFFGLVPHKKGSSPGGWR